MAKLPERYAHLDAREGLVAVGTLTIREARLAMRRSVPTRWHAVRLVDALRARLAARAFETPGLGDDDVQLFVRDDADPRLVVPTPLVRLTRGSVQPPQVAARLVNSDPVLPEDAPDGWKPGDPPWRALDPRPELRPRGPEMCGGELTLSDGAAYYTLGYDDEGVRRGGGESGTDTFTWLRRDATSPYVVDTLARPPTPPPIGLVRRADLRVEGVDVDALAAMLAEQGAANVAFRVHVPVPIPMPVEGVVGVAAPALRTALFDGTIPDDARWAAADGIEGRALGWGATPDDARAELEREAFRVKPRVPGLPEELPDAPPPAPQTTTEPKTTTEEGVTKISLGTFHLRIEGRPAPFPWPRMIPANLPALLVPLAPMPAVPDALRALGFTRTARALGAHGHVGHVFVRDEPGGLTAVGEHVVDLVDAGLDAELDAAEADMREMMPDDDELRSCVESRTVFTLWDDARRVRCPAKNTGGSFSGKLGPWDIADIAAWRVVRERRGA